MDVLITRRRQKRVSMRIKDENTLTVSAPTDYPTSEINEFICANRAWIEGKISEIAKRKTDFSSIYAFEQSMLDGKIVDILPTRENKSYLSQEGLNIPQKSYGNFDKRRREAIKFVKLYADERLRKLISRLGTELGVCPAEISVRFIRGSRIWGKCDVYKRVIIDRRVVMLPPELQRYVILHEFAHLSVFDHSSAFWKLVEKYVPDYKNCRSRLKTYSFLREIYN